MPIYTYEALNEKKQKINGRIEAKDPSDLYRILSSRSLYCVGYSERNAKVVVKRKAKNQELALFCRQLGSMIHAGMSVGQAIDNMRKRPINEQFQAVNQQIYEQLQEGVSLSEALKRNDYQFPEFVIEMVRSGEISGQLDSIMTELYDHYSREHRLNNQISSAMVYPIVLGIVVLVVVTFLMTSVLPSFFSMFENAKALPWYTVFLMNLSNSLVNGWYWYLLGIILLILLFRKLNTVDSYILWKDTMKTKWPLIGKLNKMIYTSRFASSFASLFHAGIGVIESLEICQRVLANTYYSQRIDIGIREIRSGSSLALAVEKMGCFDELLISLIDTGERSGDLDGVLRSVSEYYEQEAATATNRMVSLLQPIMIIVLGLVVGFVMIAIIVPIYSMYSSVL